MNKKNVLLSLICCIIMVIGILSVIVIKNKNRENSYQVADGMIKVDLKSNALDFDMDLENAKVYTNYNDFSSNFNSSTITLSDFDNNNYAVIALPYDECRYTNVIPTKYRFVGNSIKVIAYHDDCSSCPPMYSYYAIKVAKKVVNLKINIKWIARNGENCN